MNVAIDGSCLLINPSSGLYEVVHHLVRNLANISENHQYQLFMNYFRNHISPDTVHYQDVDRKLLRLPRRLVECWWRFGFPKFDLLYDDIDVYHSLHILVPPTKKTKIVLTVHDCRYLALPDIYDAPDVNTYRKQMISSLERSDIVVCDSEFTRKELLKFFLIDEHKVKVIHLGYQPYDHDKEKAEGKIREIDTLQRIPDEFILFLGSMDPRKNLSKFLESYTQAASQKKDMPALVIVGIDQAAWTRIEKANKAALPVVKNKIHILGILGKDILWEIFSRAKALCYPSLYEGFGFPPLEAMSLGVPVLTSDVSSIPEISGNAACYVDPMSTKSIVKGLFDVLYNGNLREELIRNGYRQLKKYSWQRTAEKYSSVYREAMEA